MSWQTGRTTQDAREDAVQRIQDTGQKMPGSSGHSRTPQRGRRSRMPYVELLCRGEAPTKSAQDVCALCTVSSRVSCVLRPICQDTRQDARGFSWVRPVFPALFSIIFLKNKDYRKKRGKNRTHALVSTWVLSWVLANRTHDPGHMRRHSAKDTRHGP